MLPQHLKPKQANHGATDTVVKPQKRKSKGKSRLGCLSCKRSRVKCDELRPKCSRCITSRHNCVYAIDERPVWKTSVQSYILPGIYSSPIQGNSSKGDVVATVTLPSRHRKVLSASIDARTSQLPSAMQNSMLNKQDAFLLNHFVEFTSKNLILSQDVWIEGVIPLAFKHAFLLHSILTISARHLQTLSSFFQINQTYNLSLLEVLHLQKALSGFQNTFHDDIHASQDVAIATSVLLCLHACSSLDFNPSAVPHIEDSSFTFVRGIRSIVIAKPGWTVARIGIFKKLLEDRQWMPAFPIPHTCPVTGPGAIFTNLLDSLNENSEYLNSKQVYVERIESLTIFLSAATDQRDMDRDPELLAMLYLRWQTLCPEKYMNLIRANDPIALIILAHFYAAVAFAMSSTGGCWWWQDKPKYMIKTIAEFIGPAWTEWLVWPKSIVEIFNYTGLEI